MTSVVINQPMLFPWPGFFEQMMLADTYLYLDDAQFSKGSFTNRVQIKSGQAIRWLSIPLEGSGGFQRIDRLRAADRDWREEHLNLLRQAYGGSPFCRDALGLVEAAYSKDPLCDLLIASIEEIASYLGIGKCQLRKRTASLAFDGKSSERVLGLVRLSGGSRYITGHGAANYLDHGLFESQGVSVEYMSYSKTPWPQGGVPFTPFVSALDLIANTGPRAKEYLRPSTTGWRQFMEERAKT
jgi:WbqC-like protein family